MDKKTEKFIINYFMDMKALIAKVGGDVSPNNTMFCIFHENTRTKSAHYYPDDDHGPCIFCYAEHRLYTNYDIYKILMPDVDTKALAEALWERLDESQKEYVRSNVNSERELPELPYISSLKKFSKHEITYKELLNDIVMSMPRDESSFVLEDVYSLPNVTLTDNTNKYVYYINHHINPKYKVISAILALRVEGIPEFLRLYFQRNGDCIIIPNIINGIIYSLTLRTIGSRKQFLKVGDVTHTLYNLGNLPEDFNYNTPLVLVEGNIDCDVMTDIYPYTVASLTSDLSTNQVQLISHITNKVIVAFDNDDSGNTGFYMVRKKLHAQGVSVERFTHYSKLHDFGDLLDIKIRDEEEYQYITRSYKNQIYSLL